MYIYSLVVLSVMKVLLSQTIISLRKLFYWRFKDEKSNYFCWSCIIIRYFVRLLKLLQPTLWSLRSLCNTLLCTTLPMSSASTLWLRSIRVFSYWRCKMKKVIALIGIVLSTVILSACSSCCNNPCGPCAAPCAQPCPCPAPAPCPCARDYKGEMR